jgi:gelsolin
MQKKKTFDIADSNIALLGSKLEKDVKRESAASEKAWAGAGKKEGLQIWRIEQFKVVAWPADQYGQFYTGDSYIILNTYKDKENPNKLKFDVHFWLGTATTQDEAGTAAYKTVELDTLLGDVPVQHREIESKESGLFLSYFAANGGIRILEGGAETGFRHVEATKYKPRLMHLKGRKNVRILEVPLSASSLNEGDVFVLDAGLTLYQWTGKKASQGEKTRAAQFCRQLDSERKGLPKVVNIEQNDKDENEEFWALLGGRCEIAGDAGGDEEWEVKEDRILYQLSDAGGRMEFNKVAEANRVTRDKLDTRDVFVLDVGMEIFVWIGKGASEGEKKESMVVGSKYLRDNKRPNYLPITRIHEGSENPVFEAAFATAGAGAIKRATPTASYSSAGASGGGCYLSYIEASNGSLILTWSKEPVKGALSFFQPGKPVADHKYKSNSGREELTRGTDSTPKNGFQGWCNYLKLAREFAGTITVNTKDVQVCVHDDSNKILRIAPGQSFQLHEYQMPAVGAWPTSKALFEGAVNTGRDHFINTAQAAGAALVLPKNK